MDDGHAKRGPSTHTVGCHSALKRREVPDTHKDEHCGLSLHTAEAPRGGGHTLTAGVEWGTSVVLLTVKQLRGQGCPGTA